MNGSNVLKRSAALLLISMMLSGCASRLKVSTTEAACSVLHPIDYHLCIHGPDSALNECDTPETAMSVDQYNRELAALCPDAL